MTDVEAQLHEIVAHGARAQSVEAARLLARLAADPDDPDTRSLAGALVEAYLHDPDLTR